MKDIVKKFKFKDTAVVINAPLLLKNQFIELGFKSNFNPKIKSANTLVFINNKTELIDFLKHQLKQIETDSVFWFAYPKGTSNIKTDINRDIIKVVAEEFSITAVAAIAINETWSGLRFRPIDKVGT